MSHFTPNMAQTCEVACLGHVWLAKHDHQRASSWVVVFGQSHVKWLVWVMFGWPNTTTQEPALGWLCLVSHMSSGLFGSCLVGQTRPPESQLLGGCVWSVTCQVACLGHVWLVKHDHPRASSWVVVFGQSHVKWFQTSKTDI